MEMTAGYVRACKRAIADYIFKAGCMSYPERYNGSIVENLKIYVTNIYVYTGLTTWNLTSNIYI